MKMLPRRSFPILAATLLAFTSPALAQPERSGVDQLLRDSFTRAVGDGVLSSTAASLEAILDESPNSNEALAALGIVQFLYSGERILQRIHTHGGFNLPFQAAMITGVGDQGLSSLYNPKPEPIDHEQFRKHVQDWIDEVAIAEATLARVSDEELKVRLPIGLVRVDLNNNGNRTADEQLWKIFTRVQRQFEPTQQSANDFEIAFDRGDVAWLRGYCHLMMAIGEGLLAHDTQESFERVGHIFFAKNESPHEQLKGFRKVMDQGVGPDIADLVAFIHLINFEVAEPERMQATREHLLQTLSLGHEMWDWYGAETDDDQEWIPNPAQANGAIPNVNMTEEQRDIWLKALSETTDMLEGRRLARFWRGNNTHGINLMRVFTEPSRFDLILWIHGSAATPYLEEGEFTSDDLWNDLENAFDRGVFRYMWWMN